MNPEHDKNILHIFNDMKIPLPKNFPSEIEEGLALGLDLGIGSCGQAIIADDETVIDRLRKPNASSSENPVFKGLPHPPNFHLVYMGVRAFDSPEINTSTGIKLKNPERRSKRLMRRTTRRRASRMWSLKRLLKRHDILPDDYPTDENTWKYPPQRGENAAFDKWRDWHSRMTSGENGTLGAAGPWQWRVDALDRKLEPLEFAAILLHLNKHRGFKSNRKSDKANNDKEETGKVLKALKDNKERMEKEGYRSIGEMMLKSDVFADRKRNSPNNYKAVILRVAQEDEVKIIFSKQREFGNSQASEELEKEFLAIYNKQLPLQNPVKLLGNCRYERYEKRGSALAPSIELSKALQKLNNLRIQLPDKSTVFLSEYIDAANGGYDAFIEAFSTFAGTKASRGRITWKDLRTIFSLESGIEFLDLPTPTSKFSKGILTFDTTAKLEGEDFIHRSSSKNTARGSYLLRQAIGEDLWLRMSQADELWQLDEVSFALTFFEEIENQHTSMEHWGILNQLHHKELDQELIKAIAADLHSDSPTLNTFKDTSALSSLASRKILPALSKGLKFFDALLEQQYINEIGNRTQTDYFTLQDTTVANPVVCSVVLECLKQTIHLINETGKLPGRICIELSRDMGKSISERKEMNDGIQKRTNNKNANRDNLTKELGRTPTKDELLRYELFLEQDGICPYTGEQLGGNLVKIANSTDYQVDHILPRSRSHDNSFDNKVLVFSQSNQHKQNSTPFEFSQIGNHNETSENWLNFTARIHSMHRLRKQKRRNLLNTNFEETSKKFASRHLNDSRYIARLVMQCLMDLYKFASKEPSTHDKRRVFTQPGQLTDLIRKSWGLQDLKKDEEGNRIGDKHHAIDALVCALLSEGQRQFLTRSEQSRRDYITKLSESYKNMETHHRDSLTPADLPEPWENFRNDVSDALDLFTVSRQENRKATGSLHNDTLYSVKEEDGSKEVFARKPLLASVNGKVKPTITASSLENIRGINDPRNAWLRKALREWLKDGCPADEASLPRDPQGNIIRKVYISQGKKTGRHYPQGFVTSGEQIRLDVFSKANKHGKKQYYLVPIYTYHIVHDSPPNRAIVANKEEENWTEMTSEYDFEFSLWKNARVEVRKAPTAKFPEGEHIVGLYKGTHRATGKISFRDPDNNEIELFASVKTKTTTFRKIHTDRLGREYPVSKEPRLWHGKVID